VNSDAKGLASNLSLEWDAFSQAQTSTSWNTFLAKGNVISKNFLADFKSCDKSALMESQADEIWSSISSGAAVQDPTHLNKFFVLIHADLKRYQYYYWFCFPALTLPGEVRLSKPASTFGDVFGPDATAQTTEAFSAFKASHPDNCTFFVLLFNEDRSPRFVTLAEGLSEESGVPGFADPCTLADHPGWPLRNLLALICSRCPERLAKGMQALCLRQTAQPGAGKSIKDSLVLSVVSEEILKFAGE
jgi:ubiquitin-like modifier-activating enzyme ATG7